MSTRCPFLPPCSYSLTADHSGFKKYVQDGITGRANVRLAADIVLQIGSLAEAITVTGDVAMLQPNSASVGQVNGEKQIALMPMNGRTPLTLAQLAYGAPPSSDPRCLITAGRRAFRWAAAAL